MTGTPIHKHRHVGRVAPSPHQLACEAGRRARDERIASEVGRLLRMSDGARWARIRDAQRRAAHDAGAMLVLAAAVEIYPRRNHDPQP